MNDATIGGRGSFLSIAQNRFGPESWALAYRLALVLVIAFSLFVWSDSFATTNNILNVLRQASLIFLLAAGLTLVIIAGGIDLSVAANLTLSACLAAGVMKSGGSPWLGIVVALSCGMVVGLLNGLAVTLLRLPPFLATYGMLWILQGLAFHYMGGLEIYGFPPAFRALERISAWHPYPSLSYGCRPSDVYDIDARAQLRA